MEQLFLIVYVLLSAAMIGLILLQQGKGADMGASFGSGASQTVFGSAGTGNVLSRSTAILAALFFAASVGLALVAKHKAEALRDANIPVPAVVETRDVPELPSVPAGGSGVEVPQAQDIPSAPAEPQAQAPAGGSDDIPVTQ
jgi:preprotein translocase subunit SecG